MTHRAAGPDVCGCRGFTLTEAAVVLLVAGLLIGAIALPLATQIETRRIESTTQLLELAEAKLFAYASRFGYFPCPADAASNGLEAAGTNHATGSCPTWYGFLPATTLGLTALDAQGYVVDAWGTTGSRLRYAISNQTINGIANPFTATDGLARAGVAAVMAAPLFHVCGSGVGVNAGVNCGLAQTLATNAAIVIWSVGPNAVTGGTSAHEAQNPNPNGGSADRLFVSRTRSETAGAEFDDLVRWVSAPSLVTRLTLPGVF